MNRQRTTWNVAFFMIAGVTLGSLSFHANAQTQEKVMNAEYTVTAATELSFDSGVGTISFERAEGDVMAVSVRAYKDDDAFFDKNGRVEDAELVAEQKGDRLILRVPEQDGIQLDWVIKLPQVASVDTDLGVGTIKGELWMSDISMDLGVGDIDLDLHGDYRSIKIDVGVGDSSIHGIGQIENNRFLMTANSRASSNGNARVSIDNGVGDIDITVK